MMSNPSRPSMIGTSWKGTLLVLCLLGTLSRVELFDLLPSKGLSLTRDLFDDDDVACGKQDAIRAEFPAFLLPERPEDFSLLLSLKAQQDEAVSGVMLSLDGAIFEIHPAQGPHMSYSAKLNSALVVDLQSSSSTRVFQYLILLRQVCYSYVVPNGIIVGMIQHLVEKRWRTCCKSLILVGCCVRYSCNYTTKW